MKRHQLFEFHELSWYPDLLREAQVEILDLANHHTGFARAISLPFAQVLEETGARTVLDLCSGAGGPAVRVLEALAEQGVDAPRVLLSDLFPHRDDWERARARSGRGLVDFVEEPVDATALPSDLEGELITIINALHHFPRETALAIIDEAVRRGASIFVAEGFPRDLLRASAYLPWLLLSLPEALLCTRRHRLAKIAAACTILPFFGVWDWFASALRIHEPAELIEEARERWPSYRWYHGEAPFPPWGRAVYLVGLAP